MTELPTDAIHEAFQDTEHQQVPVLAVEQLQALLDENKRIREMAEQLADSGEHKRKCKGPDCNCGWYDLIQLCYETLDSSPKPTGDKQ